MWDILISSIVFGISLGFAAKDDEGFAWWKPLVLTAGLFLISWGLGDLAGKAPGHWLVKWIGGNFVLWVCTAAMVRKLFSATWVHGIICGFAFVVIENLMQVGWLYFVESRA